MLLVTSINDKPTGAIVGCNHLVEQEDQEPMIKGSMQNLLRWTSARTIKETL
jgi:1-pyrroline-5-carboxylate dehydrogenase